MKLVELSSIFGLVAVSLIAANVLFGIATWGRVSFKVAGHGMALWHKWTGYAVAFVILIHVSLPQFEKPSGLKWLELVLPLRSAHQPLAMTFGVLGFWLLAIVIGTSYFKRLLGLKIWKKAHFLSYAALIFILAHGLLMDPGLKDRPIDLLDGEKVLIETLALILAGLGAYRWSNRQVRKNRRDS